jgi:hypothetical protein
MWKDPEVISDPVMTSAKDLPLDHPAFEDRLAWDFISSAYAHWYYDGADEFLEATRELEEAYGEHLVPKDWRGWD